MTSVCANLRLPDHPRPGRWTVVLLVVPLLVLGAGPPEVVPIRVPSAKVGAWFPPGTELRGMSAVEFDALLESARQGQEERRERLPARLLRARHFARWERDRLVGRSELVAEAAGARPSLLPLVPWTPAIDPGQPGAAALRMREDGSTCLRLEPGRGATLTLNWELVARPGSEGRRFALGLPDCDASRLILDLPADWLPEGPEGLTEEPGVPPGTRRTTWRHDGRGGPIDLGFRRRPDRGGAIDDVPALWVSGPTQIELGDATATSTTEWTVSLDPRGPRRLLVGLDEGLELIDVSGPAVERTRAEPHGAGTRVTVDLVRETTGTTALTLTTVARVPTEGPWTVPAVRPEGAFWTGGRTTIRLDATRTLKDCRELAGRRVAARPEEAGDAGVLVFEADSPRSVAELVFGRPRTDLAVEVRGQLLLGNSSPRLESQLTWRVTRGSLLGLDVDLPPAWVPDRVSVAGIDEPLTWHARTIPGGGLRIHVVPPSVEFARGSLVLNVSATASIAGGRGPISLPRIRPVGVPVVDERWLAWTESGLTLHPSSATGLAWIDPSLVIGSTGERPETPGLREALAWRWISETAEARVDRDGAPSEPGGSIRLVASAERDRLQLDWRIVIDPAGEPLRSVPLAVADPDGGPSDWRFFDDATGRELPARPIAAADRSDFGLPDGGSAWQLEVVDSGLARIVIRTRREVPWDGRGRIPIAVLPARFRSRNVVLVEVARNLRAKLEAPGLKRLEENVAAETIGKGRRAPGRFDQPSDHVLRRLAGAFGYERPGGRLELTTEALQPATTAGVIEQAVLTTFIDPRGPCRHRLLLRVALSDARSLDLSLPPGATLIRVRRDGQAVVPSRNGQARSLPLTVPSSSRSTSVFVLDYVTPRRADADFGDYRPERPSASMPYLAFRWEVVAPGAWVITDHGPSLVAADPAPPSSLPRRLSSLVPSWLSPNRGTAASARDDLIGALDRRAAETFDGEITLGECLTRWDAGPWPIVVDRMALETAGLGPRSRVAPPRLGTSPAGAARAVLAPLGLAAVPLNDAVLVTTRAEAPDRPSGPFRDPATRDAWQGRVRESLVRGSDVADRFQTIARWRGELTPRAAHASESTDLEPANARWRIRRFAAAGWPEVGASIHLVDHRRMMAWGWVAGLSVLVLGIVGRGVAPPGRVLALLVALGACLVAVARVSEGTLPVATGALAGTLGVLVYWIAPALPRRLRGRSSEVRSPSGARSRLGSSGVVAGLLAVVVALAAESSRHASAAADEAGPVLVLFPFDGQPDVTRKPDRALMRLEDYQRLKALGDRSGRASDMPLSALAATHDVVWQADGSAIVQTDLELDVPERGPATWTFPVGDARDISATLDDVAAPVFVEAGGKSASVAVTGRGAHRLRIRRVASTRRSERAESLSLPVNPLASARVRVAPGPRGRGVELPTARGIVETKGGSTEGLLGPTDHLDVRWPADGEARQPEAAGSVDAMLLWDALPAGDRLRARWTIRNRSRTSLIRLRLEPGVVVPSSTIPGVWDVDVRRTDAGSEWVARVDPPLPDGTTIRMEFWRPHAAGGRAPARAGRSLPRVELLGVMTYSGAIGFRRPADWSGRLEPSPAGDPMTEESFVRGWGNWPDEPLTLSGVARFSRAAAATVRTGPVVSRLSVQPAVELDLGPGRIDLKLEARLTQLAGRSYAAELVVPENLHVFRVDGEGLTDWSRSAGRILLRFDDPAARPLSVRLSGWLPVPADPLATGGAQQEVAVPWPAWIGAETAGGVLTVTARGPFELAGSSGIVALPPEPQAEASRSSTLQRIAYRVERSAVLGLLRWAIEPARVDVQVRSQLTIHPDSAEWVAVARYDVSGGPCDSLRLELPSAWAESAEVKLVGSRAEITRETRGPTTTLTVRPRRPIWGAQGLTVRSVRSLSAARALVFPELKAIVGGTRETYLALVNASGRRIAPAGEGGLQPIDDASRFQSEEFASAPDLPTWIFRARPEGWSLKVEAAGELPLASGQVRTSPTEIELLSDGNGSGLGSLRCQIRGRSDPFFVVGLPEGATPVWSALDGTPTRPLRASSGRWLIPVDNPAAGELTLIWKSGPASANGSFPLPSLPVDGATTFVSLWGGGTLIPPTRSRVLDSVPAYWQELTKGQQMGRTLLQQITEIDRSSAGDRERLVSAIVEFELVLRSAERAAVHETGDRSPVRDDSLELVHERVRAARAEVSDALETVGLDDLARAARIHLGLLREESASPAQEVIDLPSRVRLRRLGPGRRFLGQASTAAARTP